MTDRSTFKERLADGGRAIGCWIELFSPMGAEIVAQAGYDCVMIDLEHGPGSLMDAIPILHAVQGRDCASLMRVPANDDVLIKRALDIGVAGVMIPAVNSSAEAEAAVAGCRYPPRGRRGVAMPVIRAAEHGARWREYADTADESLLIICQVETKTAVGNIAEIAMVDGVDMLFVGPFDLSANLGYLGEPDHPTVREMIAALEKVAHAAGKLLGGIPTPGRSAAELLEAGYSLVIADADNGLLRDAARARVAFLRNAGNP
jgi:2-keto-3-deoxy-L-rhamnonate aldolase RhmA